MFFPQWKTFTLFWQTFEEGTERRRKNIQNEETTKNLRIYPTFGCLFLSNVKEHRYRISVHVVSDQIGEKRFHCNTILKLQFLTQKQLSSPKLKNLIVYTGSIAGYIEKRPEAQSNARKRFAMEIL